MRLKTIIKTKNFISTKQNRNRILSLTDPDHVADRDL